MRFCIRAAFSRKKSGPFWAYRALFVVSVSSLLATSVPAFANLDAESAFFLREVSLQLPPGTLGERRTEEHLKIMLFWYDSEQNLDDSQRARLKNRCDLLLTELDPKGRIDRAAGAAKIRKELLELYSTGRVRGQLPAVKQFSFLPREERARILRNILQNWNAAGKIISEGRTISAVVQELMAIPFEAVDQRMDKFTYSEHWGAPFGGSELNSRAHIVREIQRQLGSMKGRFVDVGSAYGVPGIILTLLNPELTYLGLELVPEKIAAAEQLAASFGLTHAMDFRKVDLSLSNYKLPEGDYFYFFNPVNPEILNSLLKQLDHRARKKKFTIILSAVWPFKTYEFSQFDSVFTRDFANGRFEILTSRAK